MQTIEFTGSISFLLNQVSTAYYARLEKNLAAVGLHYGQIYILISLWKKDGQTQKELSDDISVSPPTVSKMIKSLERGSFITCRRSVQDSRAVLVNLTEKGSAIRASVEAIWRELEAEIFASLTETEKLILQQVLQKIKENLFHE